MFRRKNPQDLGWMCAVRESEESDKSLVSGLDNLVVSVTMTANTKGETKARSGGGIGRGWKTVISIVPSKL